MTSPLFRSLRLALLLGALAATSSFAGRQGRVDIDTLKSPLYTVEGDAFVRHNGDAFCNRPLYCNHIYSAVLGGDKPYLLAGGDRTILGNLIFGLLRGGQGRWLLDAADVTSKYRPGRMEWIVRDPSWGSTTVRLEAVPAAQGPGAIARVTVENAQPGDSIVWASGGPSEGRSVLWEFDMTSQHVAYMHRGFSPADCAGDRVELHGNSWTMHTPDGDAVGVGTCGGDGKIVIADAGAWKDPAALLASHGGSQPVACGSVPAISDQPVYWSLRPPANAGAPGKESLAADFAAGLQRVEAIQKQMVVDTPDPWLNAEVGASAVANDACFREGIYTHSGMRWGVALLGWRTLFGATVYGWHDNLKVDAREFIAKQITQSNYTAPHADPAALLSSQAPDSRMFGKGRIDLHDPHHYDMQSQFFDQVQHAWRWTGDPELEKLLRPSLDLHCEYIKDCFDPAGLGIYESYANTWPTDDQWYNGGGTSEETAYAYRAELTALQLARRAGDQKGIELHAAAVARIRKGFFDLLWIPKFGYPGAYREQIGLKRLHESCWLYAIFCPIDAGLLTTEQAAQALQYTEWGLERDKMPYGGEQCWPSNWVPSIWSVREMWAGDNYQLALAYFQTGLPDDGWTVLRGTFPQQALFGPVPADTGHPAGGTDFNDCNSMLARAIVEGLFGYRPDYTNGLVTIAPQFPSGWDRASIKTPDMSIAYQRDGAKSDYSVTLTKAGPLRLQLPASTTAVQSVTVDGKPAKWELVPGFGRSIVQVSLPSTHSAAVRVICQDTLKSVPSISVSGSTGDQVTLQSEAGPVVDFHDPQGVLQNAKIEAGKISAVLTANAGNHVVFALTKIGQASQWQMFKIKVTDVIADQALAAKTDLQVSANATWDEVNLQPVLNGDITAIYQQQYVSPRPNTCSLRLATDGYSSWQQILSKDHRPPEVGLDNITSLADHKGNIVAGNGVPFLWPGAGKNIAFTSRWDNWPKSVDVPVNKTAASAWFLLCGTTNPMEVRIPNAELRMNYADGVVEKLEITPPFNFWTLCPYGGVDYDYYRDGFSLPKVPPTTVQLGKNCRGIVLNWHLRPGVALKSVTLETLSEEVVIGLMGLTLMQEKH